MNETFSIGRAILRRRSSRGWSLQKLCDEAENKLYPSSLSAVEKETSVPSVMAAYYLAKALGTTVDALIEESASPGLKPAPAEPVKRVPVLQWENASDWIENPDISTLPSGTAWEIPPENPPGSMFALVVRDDTMHSTSGPAFPVGSTIFVKPATDAEANDLVVGYTHDRHQLTFKKLIRDGSQRYLRPLNPQFPPVSIDGNFQVIGVVVGMAMRLSKGAIR